MKMLVQKKNPNNRSQYGIYLLFIISTWLLMFEEPIVRFGDITWVSIFRNVLPLIILLLLVLTSTRAFDARKLVSPFAICGYIFVVSGMIGWAMHKYQTLTVTIFAMYEHIRFWLCVALFFFLLCRLPLRDYAKRVSMHIGILSAFLLISGILDVIFEIWPRQVYRFGFGSIQLFYLHPSNLGAHVIFLLSMLCILRPYLSKVKENNCFVGFFTSPAVNTLMTFLLLLLSVATLRFRLAGLAIFFVILYCYMILWKKKLHAPILFICIAAAFLLGRKRFMAYYFSPIAFTMARGQFAINSLDIAKVNFPFGAGFGTFGSRMAQLHYSPLYYKYHMMVTPGMSPTRPSYACDTFFPSILGEGGWLGMIAYCSLIVLLIVLIFQKQKRAVPGPVTSYAIFTSVILVAFELLEATGTLAFSETYSVSIAMALALALAQCKTEQQRSD